MEPREIHEGETILVQGSAKEPYRIRLIDSIVSCSCMYIQTNVLPLCAGIHGQRAAGETAS